MSGGVLFQESLRVMGRANLHEFAERDVVHALEAARKNGPLDLLYDCGAEAGLARETLLTRGAAIFFNYAAGNLADDLADGECEYLDEPNRTGSCIQYILHNLFFSTALNGDVPANLLDDVSLCLARAGGPQLLEVRTREWTASLARTVGEAIAGLQYAAYLRLLWAGTPLEKRANDVGLALGIAGHVAKDVATRDPRISTLPPADAIEIVTWAREKADSLRTENLACLAPTLRHIDPILASADGFDDVARYYDEKTARILEKYGPGPRVHFHTGLDAKPVPPNATRADTRRAMALAQDALLHRMTKRVRGGEVLDVGCGLGGGAIHWAEALGARVTAITNVAAHVNVVETFARVAGVQDRVRALHRDAHDLGALGPFDCAVAIESSCYLNRRAWFSELARVLAPGGAVHVVDCFGSSSRFDAYWKTHIGTVGEYEADAYEAGFEPVMAETLNDATDEFWALSIAWTKSALASETAHAERTRLARSLEEHEWLRKALREGVIEYRWIAFERP